MESHISFKWKCLDIISCQGKVGPFRILSEKTSQKTKWKQKSKTTTLLLTNFGKCSFSTPLDNSGREIISTRNNATLIYGINAQNTTLTKVSNNNVINGVTIFISKKFKGSCEWYFKSDIVELEFDYTNKIQLKTFINKIRNLT